MIIALIVTITTMVSSSVVMNSIPTQIVSAYSIPGFETMEACERAKNQEIERESKTIMSRVSRYYSPEMKAECVAYPTK